MDPPAWNIPLQGQSGAARWTTCTLILKYTDIIQEELEGGHVQIPI